jgi:hypothetical protein
MSVDAWPSRLVVRPRHYRIISPLITSSPPSAARPQRAGSLLFVAKVAATCRQHTRENILTTSHAPVGCNLLLDWSEYLVVIGNPGASSGGQAFIDLSREAYGFCARQLPLEEHRTSCRA